MKREVTEQLGPLRPDETFTNYCIRAVMSGWTNGQEHMDDLRSVYSRFGSEKDFLRNRPLSAITHDVRSLEEWKIKVRWSARVVQAVRYDPTYYVGWRASLRRLLTTVKRGAGLREPWRVTR